MASGGHANTCKRTRGKIGDNATRFDPKIIDGKGGWEGVKALTGAGEKETQKPAAAVQAGAGEKNAQKPATLEEVARPVSLPPEQPPGLEVVQGKGKGGLLSGLTPAVGSLTLSGVPLVHVPAVARMSEGSRERPLVGAREEGQGGDFRNPNEKGGGAAVVDTVALVERTGRSPGESPEDAQSSQMVHAAPKGLPLIYQPVGAPVVYGLAGGLVHKLLGCLSNQPVLVCHQLEWYPSIDRQS